MHKITPKTLLMVWTLTSCPARPCFPGGPEGPTSPCRYERICDNSCSCQSFFIFFKIGSSSQYFWCHPSNYNYNGRRREYAGKVLSAHLLSREANMAGFPFESLRDNMKEDQADTVSTFTKSRLPKNSQTGLWNPEHLLLGRAQTQPHRKVCASLWGLS